jgi:uncharacterized membrane protein
MFNVTTRSTLARLSEVVRRVTAAVADSVLADKTEDVPTDPVRIRRDAVVLAGPDEVYKLIADLPRRPEWLAEIQRVDAEGVAEPGVRFTGESSLLLHDFVGESVVVGAEPGRRLTEHIVLGARLVSTWTLEPAGDGTRVRHEIDIDFPHGPLGRLERWLLCRRMMRMQRKSLRSLAALLDRA